MRKGLWGLLAVAAGVLLVVGLGGCFGSTKSKPDLVVVAFEVTGPVTINGQNQVVVPVHVAVKNQGGYETGVFKVATMYTGEDGPENVAFTVSGQTDSRYPFTSKPLESRAEVVFNGDVVFDDFSDGMQVPLYAVADSCSGDTNMPQFCRVDESNEKNNESEPVMVTLP